MERQKFDDYFIMLGKVFEWICYESDIEVDLSAVFKDEDGEYIVKPFDIKLFHKSELCIGTIMTACKSYDESIGTDYYDKFMFAKDNGVDK